MSKDHVEILEISLDRSPLSVRAAPSPPRPAPIPGPRTPSPGPPDPHRFPDPSPEIPVSTPAPCPSLCPSPQGGRPVSLSGSSLDVEADGATTRWLLVVSFLSIANEMDLGR